MGTMLQAQDPTLDDFEGHEGCNEILNVTRPDIVRAVHDAYFDVGVDCVETNTFGANLANLGGVRHRATGSRSWPRPAPGSPARSPTTGRTADQPALGARLDRARAPSCRRSATCRTPRCATPTRRRSAGMLAGGVDAVLVETAQDLLQAKAAVIGAKRALDGRRRPTCR